VSPRNNAVVSRTAVAGHPGRLVVTRGGVWAADFRDDLLWRYQPGTHTVQRITSNGEPRDLAVLDDKVYVASDGKLGSGVISRYDAISAQRDDSLLLLACSIASGEGVVWAAGCPYVQRLSTDSRHLRKLTQKQIPWASRATVENIRTSLREMTIGAGSLWVIGDALDRRLWRVDRRTGRIVATVPLPFPPRSLAVGGGAVWITDNLDDRVFPVDVATNRVGAPMRTGRGPAGVAFGAGSLWVVNALDGTLSRIDPHARRVVATIQVGGQPHEVTVGHEAVWVSDDEG
jgi:YVTN family beta-propeller protein